jgi:hypothetical protein
MIPFELHVEYQPHNQLQVEAEVLTQAPMCFLQLAYQAIQPKRYYVATCTQLIRGSKPDRKLKS